MHTAVRLGLLTVCLLAAVGLAVHYGATYDENWPHPTGDQLEGNVDDYTGERILLFGEVHAVEDDALVVHVTNDADDVVLELTVHGSTPVEPGGVVQVYGVLEADQTMTPDEVVVVNANPSRTRYKHLVSLLGGLLVAGYFLRHWRVDVARVGFEPRHRDRESQGVTDDG
ncbi:DNA-binding protein [Natronosalvus halobius]|uniref:DNA-binding protein n=1 Tax=Natronosalvus halobius TaxID=2953746 RepID=UPI0020A2281B|nr:DNA-binding protein [Natronosalvus halobius]USZ71503.1 DNA-binding protein [Natronosalvus halobius]